MIVAAGDMGVDYIRARPGRQWRRDRPNLPRSKASKGNVQEPPL